MGDEHEAGVVAQAVLLHGTDGHSVASEHVGHRGQHAGPVGDLQADVVLGPQVVDRADAGPDEPPDAARTARGEVDGRVDEVAQNGSGGGSAARAPAVEHEFTDRVALDEHGVEAVAHAGQRVLHRHHGRMDPHGHLRRLAVAPPGALGHRDGLDRVAQTPGHLDVVEGDPGDSLVVDVAGHDHCTEGDGGDDGGLGAGVEPLDVRGGVALGIAQALGLAQRFGVAGAALGHLGEDVVGRAVDDAHDPLHRLSRQRLPEGTDEGDGPRDGGLEQQIDTGVVGGREQLRAVVGQQLLVARHDRLALRDGVVQQAAGRLDPADDFHDDVDLGICDDAGRVGAEHRRVDVQAAVLGGGPHRDPGDLQLDAGAGRHCVALLVEQRHESGAHVAAAEESDTEPVHPSKLQPTRCGPSPGQPAPLPSSDLGPAVTSG